MKFDEKNNLLRMNLQMFAEDGEQTEQTDENSEKKEGTGDDGKNTDAGTPTYEELLKQLAEANAEKAKWKSNFDNAASEASSYKKQLRAKQTAQEIQDEEKQKAEEEQKKYIAELEAFKQKAEAEARYALQGMSKELAKQAAEAEVKGDMDELASIQRKHTEALLKEKEREWLKSRPDINAGNGEGDEKATLEKQIENIMLNGIL